MKRIDFRRVFVAGGLASLAIVYALLWARMVSSPAERTGSDFISVYTGGWLTCGEGQMSIIWATSRRCRNRW